MTPRVQVEMGDVAAWANRTLESLGAEFDARIQGILRDDVRAQFAKGGEPAWQPLAPSTVRAKRAAGYPRLNRRGLVPVSALQNGQFAPANKLMMTMALYSSWTDSRDPNHVATAEEGAISIGSSLAYAAVHQHGATINHPNVFGTGRSATIRVPARPLVVTDRAAREIAGVVTSSLTEGN